MTRVDFFKNSLKKLWMLKQVQHDDTGRIPSFCHPELVSASILSFKQLLAAITLLLISIAPLQADYFPTPVAMPDDSSKFFRMGKDDYWATSILYEEGSGCGGFNGSDQKKSLGNIYSNGESALAMLRNPVSVDLSAIPLAVRLAPDYGGQRGIINVSGHVFQRQITLAGGAGIHFLPLKIPGFLDVGFYMPFVIKKFDTINIQLKPFPLVDAVSQILAQYTQNMGTLLQQNGGLNAEAWQGTGVGDPTVIIRWNWHKASDQATAENDTLRHINPYMYFGFQIPASKQRDEDKMFSLPLGNDGHWGIPFGTGLDFTFTLPIKIGVGLDFLYLAAETRMRRVKTDVAQTSLLLLNKANVKRSPGLTWRFNWFVEGEHLWHGLGARAGYEFVMHHNDTLDTSDTRFSNAIMSSVETAEQWYANLLSASIKYDLSAEFEHAPMAPVLEGFMKFPLSGRHVVNASTVGFQMVMHF